jgi:hypothetical protein
MLKGCDMTVMDKNEKLRNAWMSRKFLTVTFKNLQRLKKGKRVYLISDGVGYEICPRTIPEVFDSKGNRLNRGDLRKLLRVVK